MLITIQLNGQVQWEVAQTSGGRWIGVCRPLGLSMQGDSLDDLYQNINQAVQLLLSDLFETGELDAFLQHRGWRAHRRGPPQHQGPVEFEVPFELLVRTARDSARTLLQ